MDSLCPRCRCRVHRRSAHRGRWRQHQLCYRLTLRCRWQYCLRRCSARHHCRHRRWPTCHHHHHRCPWSPFHHCRPHRLHWQLWRRFHRYQSRHLHPKPRWRHHFPHHCLHCRCCLHCHCCLHCRFRHSRRSASMHLSHPCLSRSQHRRRQTCLHRLSRRRPSQPRWPHRRPRRTTWRPCSRTAQNSQRSPGGTGIPKDNCQLSCKMRSHPVAWRPSEGSRPALREEDRAVPTGTPKDRFASESPSQGHRCTIRCHSRQKGHA